MAQNKTDINTFQPKLIFFRKWKNVLKDIYLKNTRIKCDKVLNIWGKTVPFLWTITQEKQRKNGIVVSTCTAECKSLHILKTK